MKTLSFLLTALLLVALSFTACDNDKTDACADILCLNGGTCDDGECDCPDGYSGTLCAVYDSCFAVICMNGGTCDNGTCDCPDGYSGTLCAVYDSCFAVICMNGGTCDNGTCDCPDGFGGANCGDTLVSILLTIDKITVNSYPTTRANGQSWDVADGADAFMSLTIGSSPSTNGYSSETINNVTGSTLVYNAGLPTNTGGAHTINWTLSMWDADAGNINEAMANIVFSPTALGAGNPSTINLKNADLDVTLDVTWKY